MIRRSLAARAPSLSVSCHAAPDGDGLFDSSPAPVAPTSLGPGIARRQPRLSRAIGVLDEEAVGAYRTSAFPDAGDGRGHLAHDTRLHRAVA